MANEFLIAHSRDAAARRRLEGKSGAIDDWLANSLEAQNRNAEREEAEQKAWRQESARQEERERDREEAREQAEEESERLNRDARWNEQSDRIYRELIRAVSELTARVAPLSQAKSPEWQQVLNVGCEIRCAEILLDHFNLTDATLIRQLSELRNTADGVATRCSGRPTIDSYMDHGRKVIRALIEAKSVTDRNFIGSHYTHQKGASLKTITHLCKTEWPVDVKRLLATMPPLLTILSQAQWLGLVNRQPDGTVTTPKWVRDLLRATVLQERALESDAFISGTIESLLDLLAGAQDIASANAYVRRMVAERKGRWALAAREVAEQLALIESNVKQPQRIGPTLRDRPFKWGEYEFWYPPQPAGIGGLLYRINGNAKRDLASLMAHVAKVRKLAADFAEAFDAVNPDLISVSDMGVPIGGALATSEPTLESSSELKKAVGAATACTPENRTRGKDIRGRHPRIAGAADRVGCLPRHS